MLTIVKENYIQQIDESTIFGKTRFLISKF